MTTPILLPLPPRTTQLRNDISALIQEDRYEALTVAEVIGVLEILKFEMINGSKT